MISILIVVKLFINLTNISQKLNTAVDYKQKSNIIISIFDPKIASSNKTKIATPTLLAIKEINTTLAGEDIFYIAPKLSSGRTFMR